MANEPSSRLLLVLCNLLSRAYILSTIREAPYSRQAVTKAPQGRQLRVPQGLCLDCFSPLGLVRQVLSHTRKN